MEITIGLLVGVFVGAAVVYVVMAAGREGERLKWRKERERMLEELRQFREWWAALR